SGTLSYSPSAESIVAQRQSQDPDQRPGEAPESLMPNPTAFFEGRFVPLAEANINIMTHAFNYGTAVFEGVRGNWNSEQEELYLFKVRDHVRRIRESAKIMRMDVKYSEDEMCNIILEAASQ